MYCHSLLACRVSAERSAVNLLGIPLYVICCFSPAAFNIFSFYLIFDSLINRCLGIKNTVFLIALPLFLNPTKQYLKKEKNIYITPFGVDTDLFKKINLKKDENKIVIGIVKTLMPKYGIEYLIRAIDELKKILDSNTYEKIEVHIYGTGYLKEELEELSKKLKVDDKIKFLGYVNNKKVPEVINMMDVFVIPSILDSESFGVAAVEAYYACEAEVSPQQDNTLVCKQVLCCHCFFSVPFLLSLY